MGAQKKTQSCKQFKMKRIYVHSSVQAYYKVVCVRVLKSKVNKWIHLLFVFSPSQEYLCTKEQHKYK